MRAGEARKEDGLGSHLGSGIRGEKTVKGSKGGRGAPPGCPREKTQFVCRKFHRKKDGSIWEEAVGTDHRAAILCRQNPPDGEETENVVLGRDAYLTATNKRGKKTTTLVGLKNQQRAGTAGSGPGRT